MKSPFLWGASGQQMTPEQVARMRVAAALQGRQGSETTPVAHWTQAAARAFNGALAGRGEYQANMQENAGLASADASIQGNPVLSALMGGEQMAAPAAPVQGGMPVAAMPQEARSAPGADAIRAGLIQRGLPGHVADAFIMNFQDESGLNPGIEEHVANVHGTKGFGLAQWTGPRRDALTRFAQSQGRPVSDVNTQLDFLMTELQGPESRAAQAILGAQDTGSAAAAIVNNFLRPAEEHRARREAAYTGGFQGASAGVAGTAPQAPSGVVAALTAAQQNPWVAQKYGPVIDALMQQEMGRQDASYQQQLAQQDPMYQAQLEAAQIANAQALQPVAQKPIEVGGVLLDPVTYQPIFDSRQPAEGGFTLGEGQVRYDAAGNVIAQGGSNDPWAGTQVVNGQIVQMGANGPQVIGDYRTADPGFSMLSPDEVATLGLDPANAYQRGPDGRVSEIGGNGTNVTVNNGGTDAFADALGKADAGLVTDVSTAGLAAQRNLPRIDALEQALAAAPSGAGALWRQRAGEWGIQTEGLSEIQAAQALINSLVPEQRQPGSGPMSDADLELFKQSLPRLVNTKEGNQQIINTMRGIAEYDAMGAAIAQQIRSGEISRAEGIAALQARPNPLATFRSPTGDAPAAPQRRRYNPETGGFE